MQTFFCILRILPSAIVQTKIYRWFYISIKYTIETTVTIDREVKKWDLSAIIALAFHSPSRIKKKKVNLLLIYIISVYLNTLPPTTQHIHYPIILLSTQKKKTYIRLNSLKYTRHLTALLDPIHMYMHVIPRNRFACIMK